MVGGSCGAAATAGRSGAVISPVAWSTVMRLTSLCGRDSTSSGARNGSPTGRPDGAPIALRDGFLEGVADLFAASLFTHADPAHILDFPTIGEFGGYPDFPAVLMPRGMVNRQRSAVNARQLLESVGGCVHGDLALEIDEFERTDERVQADAFAKRVQVFHALSRA